MKKLALIFIFIFAAGISQANELIMLKRIKNPPANIDDSVRINAAIEQLSNAGGGTLMLLGGKFYVANPIIVLDNVTLRGKGPGTQIILVDNAPSFAGRAGIVRLIDDRDNTPVENVLIEDLQIDGNRDNQAQGVAESEQKFCLYAEGDNIAVRRVIAENCMGYGFNPHGKRQPSGPRVASTNIVFEDNIARNNLLDGFTIDQTEHSEFRSNTSHSNGRHGFNLIDNSAQVMVHNNITRKNAGSGITVQNGAAQISITNNRVKNNGREGIIIRQSDNNQIINNLIHNNGFDAIRLRGSSNNTIELNTAFNNSKAEKQEYYELRFEDYNGFASTFNNMVQNVVISHRSVGVVLEKDNANNNKYYDNTYKTKVDAFQLKGDGSQAYDNRPAIED